MSPDNQFLNIIDAKALNFEFQSGRLHMTIGEISWENIRIIPAFPFQYPDRFLSIQGTKEGETEQKEIGILEDLASLDPELQALLRTQIASSVFIPAIRRINSVSENGDYHTWEVETDKGNTSFITRDTRDKMRSLGPHRCLIEDIDDNRYEIIDTRKLDGASRKWIDLYL